MRPATRTFIRQRFSDYYKNGILFPPSSIAQREFGFIFFDSKYPDDIRMKRHIGLFSSEEMETYIRNLVPAHAYYSTAYYENPGAPTMQEKNWSGADLIFDLDADHIMRGRYDAMLERIKQETYKLLDVLTDELGFQKQTIKIVFSGGRGYHIHVSDIAFRTWTSPERREIIDYVCGIGIQPKAMMYQYEKGMTGWPSRFRDTLLAYLEQITAYEEVTLRAELTAYEGVGDVRARRFIQMLPDVCSRLRNDPCSINMNDQTIEAILNAMCLDPKGTFYHQCRQSGVQADEPVTTDIKRLIRLPGSLHAKSGFRVVPLTIKELPDFNPLVDAVVFSDRDLVIESAGSYEMSLLDNQYHIDKGLNTVPEALGMFLCCRGMGEVTGDG